MLAGLLLSVSPDVRVTTVLDGYVIMSSRASRCSIRDRKRRRGLLGIAIGVVLGGVGLWACLRAGSRALVAGASDTAREQAPDNSALNHH